MRYQNPILKAFHPDPSICRVGDEFYLVTSSFSYFPGLPIYKSKDLLHWSLAANAITEEDQLPLKEAASSGGIWAPTIRHQDGVFYITATFSEKGNFIVASTDIKKGFGNPIWVEMDGIDPSLFFENGEAYYCANDIGSRMEKYGSEGISVARIDVNSGKLLQEPVRIWEGTGGGFLESPHIYHIGSYYYLMIAEGGTSLNHMITVARSKTIYGPYEGCPGNPVLTNRNDTSKSVLCTGHGDLVEDTAGNWWLVHLGTRPSHSFWSHLGRETFLMPVRWKAGWPLVGEDAKCHLEEEGPLPAAKYQETGEAEDQREWMTLRGLAQDKLRIAGNDLTLTASAATLSEDKAVPSMALIRQKDFTDVFWSRISFEPLQDGDYAGLVVYLSNQFYYCMGIKRENGVNYLIVEKTAEDFHQISFREVVQDGEITLGIEAEKTKYHFMISEKGAVRELCNASTRFLCCEAAGKCFTGTLWGVFAESRTEGSISAKFSLEEPLEK